MPFCRGRVCMSFRMRVGGISGRVLAGERRVSAGERRLEQRGAARAGTGMRVGGMRGVRAGRARTVAAGRA